MGGQIALRLAEEHPGLFDGVVPMCGVVGGALMDLANWVEEGVKPTP